MFLDKKYILANELTQKANIHIANISGLVKGLEEHNLMAGNVEQMGNCTFISKTSKYVPAFIKNYMEAYTYTDMSNKIPSTYLGSSLEIPYPKIVEGFKKNKIDVKEEVISGKRFTVFPTEFVEKMKNKTWFVLNKEEYIEQMNEGNIEGGIPLYKNQYLTWY